MDQDALTLAIETKNWDVVKIILSKLSPWDIRNVAKNLNVYKKLKSVGIFEELRFLRNDPDEVKDGNAWKSHIALETVKHLTRALDSEVKLLFVPYRTRMGIEFNINITNRGEFEELTFGKPVTVFKFEVRITVSKELYEHVEFIGNQFFLIESLFGLKERKERWRITRDEFSSQFTLSWTKGALNGRLFMLLSNRTGNTRKWKIFIRDPKDRYDGIFIRECITCGKQDDLLGEETSDKIFCNISCQRLHYN